MMQHSHTATPKYTGRRQVAFKRLVFQTFGEICIHCGGQADTVDHLVPQSVRPDLAFELTNARPACRSCNSSRKAGPLIAHVAEPGW